MVITAKDIRWMNLAAKTARISTHPKYKFAALIIKGGNVISVGTNSLNAPKRFTNPHRSNMHLHAEVDALFNLDRQKTKNATLVVNGVTIANNQIKSTLPCKTCASMIEKMGIKRIVFMKNGQIEELK